MQLPALKDKLKVIFTKRNILFILVGVVVFLLLLITIEVIYCFSSETCILNLGKTSPLLGKLTGVKETDLSFRRGNYALSKQLGVLTVSGKIIKVEKDSIILKSEDGSEEKFLVKKGSRFVILESLSEADGIGEREEKVFTGDNLEDFLPSGYFLMPTPIVDSYLSSKYSVGSTTRETFLVVVRSEE